MVKRSAALLTPLVREMAPRTFKHIHRFEKTGRWGAWIKTYHQKVRRIYLGTHRTQHLAARAQDRANLKLKNLKMKLNFPKSDYNDDENLRNTLDDDSFLELLRSESRSRYNISAMSQCLRKFLALERLRRSGAPQPLAVRNAPEVSPEVLQAAATLVHLMHDQVDVKQTNLNLARHSAALEPCSQGDLPQEKKYSQRGDLPPRKRFIMRPTADNQKPLSQTGKEAEGIEAPKQLKWKCGLRSKLTRNLRR